MHPFGDWNNLDRELSTLKCLILLKDFDFYKKFVVSSLIPTDNIGVHFLLNNSQYGVKLKKYIIDNMYVD